MGEVHMISGDATPPVFCGKLMELSDEIEDIVCAVRFKDGTSRVFWTSMRTIDIVWLRWVLDQDFRPERAGGDDET